MRDDGLDGGLLKAMALRSYRYELVSACGEKLYALGATPECLAAARRVIGNGCVILPRKSLTGTR